MARLDPQQDDTARAPEVRVFGFRIGGSSYPMSFVGEREIPRVIIPRGYSPIEIEYASAATNVDYEYRLEGADAVWRRAAGESMTLAGLPAGSYRFAVRAVRRGSGAAGLPATVSFTIVPPFWQRQWFFAAVAIALVALGYGIHRYRLAQLLALERIRTRIATDLHDDIGSSLSRIAILSPVASRRLDGVATEVGETLDSIGQTAGELVDSMSDIVWAINPRHDALDDLTGRMRRFASDLLTAKDIAFRFDAPAPDGEVHLGPDLRREVFLTFKEGLTNIARHAHCTEVSAALRIQDGSLDLALADNGVGFDTGTLATGHGLVNLRARVAALHGSVDIRSGPGRGTSLHVRLPLRVHRRGLPRLHR